MLALWQIAVEETRALLTGSWGDDVVSRSDTTIDAMLSIWGAGAIGGTLGAYLARAGDDVTLVDTVVEHVDADHARRPPRHRADRRVHGARARLHAADAQRHVGRRSSSPRRRITPTPPSAHCCPHLTADGYVVSAQNGLNELAIAEVVGAERTVGAFVNFGADYLEPGVIHYGGRGAVVVGEIDGRITPRVTAIRDAWRAFRSARDRDAQHLGLPVGQGSLRRDAVRHGADQRVDRRRARHARVPARCTSRWRARSSPSRRPAPFGPRRSTGSIPRPTSPTAPAGAAERSLDALVAHNRRSAKSHSGIWRDLAVRKRPTEVDAQLGIVVTLGAEAGVPTPLTARLVALIHEIERGARPQSLDTLDALAADTVRTTVAR